MLSADKALNPSSTPWEKEKDRKEGEDGVRVAKLTGRVEEREKERKRSGKVGNTLPSVMGHLS